MAWHDKLTKEEKSFIRKHFKDMTLGEIALSLGRSYFTVQSYAASLNLHRFHKWTEEEDSMLLDLWGKGYCAEYIARRMKLNATGVYNRLRRMKMNGKLQDSEARQ